MSASPYQHIFGLKPPDPYSVWSVCTCTNDQIIFHPPPQIMAERNQNVTLKPKSNGSKPSDQATPPVSHLVEVAKSVFKLKPLSRPPILLAPPPKVDDLAAGEKPKRKGMRYSGIVSKTNEAEVAKFLQRKKDREALRVSLELEKQEQQLKHCTFKPQLCARQRNKSKRL